MSDNTFHPNWKSLSDCQKCGEFMGHGHVCQSSTPQPSERGLLSLLDAERIKSDELEQRMELVRRERDEFAKRVRELEGALAGGYTILKALDISVKWELAPTIKQTIKEWCEQAESLLSKEQK